MKTPWYLNDVKSTPNFSRGFGTFENIFGSNDIPDDAHVLVKYVNPWLFKYIVTEGLNFTRFDVFADEFDGALPKFEALYSPALYSSISERSKILQRHASVSCWSLNDEITDKLGSIIDANGGDARTVVIETSIDRVVSALDWPGALGSIRGPILYTDQMTFDVLEGNEWRTFFWKEEKWTPEQEYRFVFHYDVHRISPAVLENPHYGLEKYHPMRCSPSELISKVYLRPGISPDERASVKRLCKAHGVPVYALDGLGEGRS